MRLGHMLEVESMGFRESCNKKQKTVGVLSTIGIANLHTNLQGQQVPERA